MDQRLTGLTASEAMGKADNRHTKDVETPRAKAKKWLEEFLEANTDDQMELGSNGKPRGVLKEVVMAAAARAYHSKNTVNRAAEDLGVVKTMDGRKVLWSLPDV